MLIRAGYSAETARQMGAENLSKPVIQDAIQDAKSKRSERVQISQDDVLRDLMELRDMCMGRKSVIVTDTVKNNQEGTVTAVDNPVYAFEPTGANKALELLGKHLGMFSQKVELSGTVTNQNVELTKVEFADLAKELLAEV